MKHLLLLALSAAITLPSLAQHENRGNEWYIGTGGGLHFSKLLYSDLNKSHFPENNSNLSGVYSVFGEFDFGRENMFAVRPQFSFLTRGGRLSRIGSKYYPGYNPDLEDASRLEDVVYRLKATCFDIRVPFLYQIGKRNWKVRPYVFIAPILSVVDNGYVSISNEYADGGREGYRYDLTNANMASVMFSGAVGLGAKWQFDVNGNNLFVGLDVSYEHTFTNTYGKGEKDGTVGGVSLYPGAFKVDGARRMHGFEVSASIGIPLSVFSKKKTVPAVEPVYEETVIEEPMVVEVEPECYSLEEISNLMALGRSVVGKKICAIDDINFAFNKSDIQPSSYKYLDKLAKTFSKIDAKIIIIGHTDNVGSDEFNMELSRKRAEAVLAYLVNKGVERKRLTYRYYGMRRPISDNDTEEGRRMNRRVEFEILK